jgi:hypothetical protein
VDVVSVILSSIQNKEYSRKEVLELLEVFRKLGLIEHVVEKEKLITDEFLFFKFTEISKDETGIKSLSEAFESLSSQIRVPSKTVYEFKALDIDKNEIEFSRYKGKVLVVTNVACK